MRRFKMEVADSATGGKYVRAVDEYGGRIAAFTAPGRNGSQFGWVTYKSYSADVHKLLVEKQALLDENAALKDELDSLRPANPDDGEG